MAPLTWRNVAAPGLGDPVDALRLSGSLLDRGFTNLNESIGRFSTWKDDQNARLVNDAALRIQDPEQFRAALENGTLLGGMPGGSLTPAAMTALQGRAGTLIEQATGQQALDHARQINPIQVGQAQHNLDRARIDAPLQTEGLALRNTRTGQEIRAEDFQHGERVYRAPGERTMFDQRVELAGATQPNLLDEQRRIGLGRVDTDAANAAISDSQRIVDGGDARTFLDEQRGRVSRGEISPAAFQAIERNVMGRFASTFAPVSGTSTTAAPGAGAPAVAAAAAPIAAPGVTGSGGTTPAAQALAAGAVGANPNRDPRLALPSPEGTHGTQGGSPYDVTYGHRPTAAPITTMPIGDVLNLQQQYIRDHGGSPMGAFQIVRGTLEQYAPRVLGENWRSVQFTPEVQDRIGRAIFEANKRGNLVEQWDALRNVPGASERGAFANRSWEDVRGMISQREARTTADGAGGQAPRLTPRERADAALRESGDITHQQDRLAGQLRGGSLVPGLNAASNSQESPATVLQQLRQAFPNEEEGKLSTEMARLMRGNGPNGVRLTAAEAGLIMIQATSSRNRDSRNWWQRNMPDAVGGEAVPRETGSIATFDSAANDTLARRYREGQLEHDERSSREIQGNQAALAGARTAVENARNQVTALRARAAEDPTNPRIAGAVERAEDKMRTAAEALERVNERLRGVRARRDNTGATGGTNGQGREAIAAAAGERGPTRGSQVSEAAGGGGTQNASPEVRASGPGGTARPGTIPRARRINEDDPGGAAMWNTDAPRGRQADETGVNQTSLALGLLATAAGGGANAIRHGYNAFRYGRYMLPEITVATPGVGGAAGAATGRIAGTTAAEAAGQAAAQTPARLLLSGPGRVAPPSPSIPPNVIHMGQSAGTRAGEILATVARGAEGGASLEQSILAAARQYGLAPETIARAVRAASGR